MDETLVKQMQARFHEATAEWNALEQERAPHRDRYNALARRVDELKAEQQAVIELVRPIELKMSELSNERATISRALNGKTGESTVSE